MAVRRDFAFLTPESVPAGDLMRALAGADKQLISDVALFDRYQGKGVPEGHVSLALEVTPPAAGQDAHRGRDRCSSQKPHHRGPRRSRAQS